MGPSNANLCSSFLIFEHNTNMEVNKVASELLCRCIMLNTAWMALIFPLYLVLMTTDVLLGFMDGF